MHISRIMKKSKTSFPRMGRYRFTYHGKNKSSFTFHAKQKCPFTCHKKSIGDLLQSHSGLLHLVISWLWTRKNQIVQIVKYPWNFTVCLILLGTTVNTWDTCTTVTIFYQVTYIFGENDTCTTSLPIFRVINLVSDIDNQLNALWWKCRDSRLSIQARFVAKKQETKCYLNWALYYRGNTCILPKRCRSRTNTILRFT